MSSGVVRIVRRCRATELQFAQAGRCSMTQESVCRRKVIVKNENGLHLIPCSLIAKLARRVQCEVTISNGRQTADAKNVLDIIALAAVSGTELDVDTNGEGAEEAISALVLLFESNFQSEESTNS
jgi:phosphotransferase system HPr (HPr) family protein